MDSLQALKSLPEIDRYMRFLRLLTTQVSTTPDFGQSVDSPNIFFVDGTNGSDNNSGKDPAFPKATIQDGIDATVSDRGDVIFIMPGSYAENLVITSKNYVALVGVLKPGYARPDVVPTTGVALDINTSQGTILIGIRFYSADADVVQNEGNGFHFENCVFDGDTGQAATECLLRLRGNASDDSYTASEGLIQDCLFRLSNGFGVALDTGSAPANGVGVTHAIFRRCRFVDNAQEDVIALDSGGGVYAAQDNLFDQCYFMKKNKATYIDISTNLGSANTDNVFSGCYFNDDTIDTTAIKMAGTGSGVVGSYSLD